MSGALPRAILDSNVIYSRVLHELFGRLAKEARRFDLIWSNELLEEARRVLRENKPVDDEVARRWVSLMRLNFPDGEVDITSLDPDADLPSMTRDPGDQHVCALAIAGEADVLFTSDRGFLNEALKGHGVDVLDPDVFLSDDLALEPDLYARVIAAQAAAWGGGRPVQELIDAYERANAVQFAHDARLLFEAE